MSILVAISLPSLSPEAAMVLELWVAPRFYHLGPYSPRHLTSGVEIPTMHIRYPGVISLPGLDPKALMVLELWVAPRF